MMCSSTPLKKKISALPVLFVQAGFEGGTTRFATIAFSFLVCNETVSINNYFKILFIDYLYYFKIVKYFEKSLDELKSFSYNENTRSCEETNNHGKINFFRIERKRFQMY